MKKKIDSQYYDSSDYFNHDGGVYKDLDNRIQRYRIANVLKIYRPTKNEKILDLGCGWGTFSMAIAPLCKEIVGLDYSSKSVEICRRLAREKKLNNVQFMCADASKTGLKSESFDVIISADLFEHIYPEDFIKIIKESNRILKKKGKLVVWTPHRGHFIEILKNNDIILERDISHVDYKSMKVLISALEDNGFTIKKNYYAESHIPILSYIERLMIPFFSIFRRRIAILAIKS